MDVISKLDRAPASVFDFAVECTESGFIPSAEDVMDEFGEDYAEWANAFPNTRIVLDGEITDEEFSPQSPYGHMKDCGHQLSDFE